jgi:hypothetical protein
MGVRQIVVQPRGPQTGTRVEDHTFEGFMRPVVLSLCLIVATLLRAIGTAQVAYRPTPAPQVTAGNAIWQIDGEPIVFARLFYYPTGPTEFFDGQLMARVGEYLTVPLYADT